jgi:ATP-dependent Lhr-like helicase
LHDSLLQYGFLTLQEAMTGTATAGSPADASRWGSFFKHLQRDQRATLVQAGDHAYWVAAERLAELQVVYPGAAMSPVIDAWGEQPESFEQALVALLRSRFAGQGPMTPAQVQQDFAVTPVQLETALLTLEQEGYLLKTTLGRDGRRDYWCERRLLARIHRYSREQKRRKVQPVAPQALLRFLCKWHSLDDPQAGEQAIYPVLSMLEGWAATLAAWDHGVLPARLQDVDNSSLDQVFLNGAWAWFRPGKPGAGESAAARVVSSSPVVMYQRSHGQVWNAARMPDGVPELGEEALRLFTCLQSGGAAFASELMERAGLLETRFEDAIAELIAAGLVNSDSLSALRYLLRREQEKHRMRKRAGRFRPASAPLVGRWSLLTEAKDATLDERHQHISHICNVLLRRYGVVFRTILEREPLLPPWRILVRWLRRMEDRGEVLGGRFVSEFSGEQFALAEAAALLRQSVDQTDQRIFQLHACDPLNLAGVLSPGALIPARNGNSLLLRDGLVVAAKIGDKVEKDR